ncbi:TPA: DUF1963 domain-containing protein [Morganella morganii]|uniref:YwqG family protein n=1 Tax=Morganella TaxID=581 RepID=UPI001A20DD15|nr:MULTISPECIES: YwqG family protein [Morganella]MCU6210642.1 DUF1963 domain-containing protein [Morganella morganii]MDH0353889.1 YwqG family protein [Morganella sp. GD04133]HAT1514001.1 DUF1963 domain-containing protein [Morganella morganii]HBH7052117.1 DUF1963 domain-containing protein [Morganella morganii]
MYEITQFIVSDNKDIDSGLIIGGNKGYVSEWPVNPNGKELLHLFSIDCEKVAPQVADGVLPKTGYLSIFSTYSSSDYFLDEITYFGDEDDLNLIRSGFTFVSYSLTGSLSESNEDFIPETKVDLLNTRIDSEEYPMISFFSKHIPNGLTCVDEVFNNYHFVCQVYSADFPSPFKDVLGLSDAIGYLFIKNEGNNIEGLFFVQTA